MLFYEVELGIALPDMTIQDMGSGQWFMELDEPREYCLVRTPRRGRADHYGLFVSGYVLSADCDKTIFVPLRQYLSRHPDSKFIAIRVQDEAKSS